MFNTKTWVGSSPACLLPQKLPSFTRPCPTFIQMLQRKERKAQANNNPIATAVNHHDNLEFLEDVIPKTVPYKKIKDQAAAARIQPRKADSEPKKRKSTNGVNGVVVPATASDDPAADALRDDDPSAQLEAESRQAAGDGDVDMTG